MSGVPPGPRGLSVDDNDEGPGPVIVRPVPPPPPPFPIPPLFGKYSFEGTRMNSRFSAQMAPIPTRRRSIDMPFGSRRHKRASRWNAGRTASNMEG